MLLNPARIVLFPRLKRLPVRKPVTISVGFRFSHGFLVCSDSHCTIGAMKVVGRKVFRAAIGQDRMIFGIAGTVPYGKMFIEKLIPRIAAIPDAKRTKAAIRSEVENWLFKFYKKHIFPHPFFQREGGPDFNLIIGTWSHLDGLDCFSTSETTVTDVNDYECIGYGQDVARLAIKGIFRHKYLSRDDAVNVAVHVLRETKENIIYCGGDNQFAFLTDDGDMGSGFRLKTARTEEISSSFSFCTKNLYLFVASPNTTEEQMDQQLDYTVTLIKAIRKHALEERPTSILSGPQSEEDLK